MLKETPKPQLLTLEQALRSLGLLNNIPNSQTLAIVEALQSLGVHNNTPKSRYLSVNQALQRLRIGRTKFYQILNTGQLKAVKLGNRTLVDCDSLETYILSLPAYAGAKSTDGKSS